MAKIATIGSADSGHITYPPRVTSSGSSNVFAEGKGVHRQGDSFGSHTNTKPPYDTHSSSTNGGSSTVFCNSKKVARVGDPSGCGGTILTGISSVRVGG